MARQNVNIDEKLNQLDERSSEVKEILGRAPNWVIQWGTTVVFGVMVLLILSATVAEYNDIIRAQVTITSKNPPVYLKANNSGRLTHVFAEPNQLVQKEDILAEVENTAVLEDILYLKTQIGRHGTDLVELDSLNAIFHTDLKLGGVQTSYGEFISEYQNHILFNVLSPNKKESASIQQQLTQQRRFLSKQRSQLTIFKQDLELSKNSFERNSQLFDKGVISKAEYEQASRDYLSDKQQYEGFLTGIANTQIAIANFTNLLTKSNIQGTEFKTSYKQNLDRAFQNLSNNLSVWEQQYLIKTPITGKVTVFDIWNEHQNIEAGTTLFTVVPEDVDEIIGRVTLPIRNSGKVKLGQKVLIKLDNYPFEEWGSLEGEIAHISEVPQEGEQANYILYVQLNGLRTSFGKEIAFKQEMQGSAEIIIEELTIMQRIFYQLRKVLNQA